MPTFHILHTNDFHNHLSPTQGEALAGMRKTLGGNGLLLDAGDAVSSGNITYKSDGEPILALMSSIGYDAMTVGNREFHFSRHGFASKVKRARFPVLCANVRSVVPDDPLPVTAAIRCQVAECTVGILGLTVPMITERMLARHISAYVFDPPIDAARTLLPTLRRMSDLTVVLSHCGLATDRLLAEADLGIDLIIGGHSHAVLPEGEWVGDTLIVQAGWFAKYLGTVEVELSKDKRRLEAKLDLL